GERPGREAPQSITVHRNDSIQRAVDRVAPGGTVRLDPEVVYFGSVTVWKPVNIIGTIRGKLRPVIEGQRPTAVEPLERPRAGIEFLGEGAGGLVQGVAVRGFDNTISGSDRGGRLTAVTVKDVIMSGSARGIRWNSAADLTADHIRITNTLWHGISWTGQGLGSITISNAYLSQIGGTGFGFFNYCAPRFGGVPTCSPSL